MVADGHGLLLCKRETGEVYTVTPAARHCTFKAGQCKLECKHLAAVLALCEELPDLLGHRPATHGKDNQ